jgi:hypothetical protein
VVVAGVAGVAVLAGTGVVRVLGDVLLLASGADVEVEGELAVGDVAEVEVEVGDGPALEVDVSGELPVPPAERDSEGPERWVAAGRVL